MYLELIGYSTSDAPNNAVLLAHVAATGNTATRE